jgi:hypothetical protein
VTPTLRTPSDESEPRESASPLFGSRLPNFVIAGVGGAGTTSLFSYLAQHPDICASSIKEVKYFSPLRYGEPLPPLETYARYFRHCGDERYVMEATPGYFYGGEPLASAMKERLPDAHVLVVLRDPSARLWSSFNYVKMRLKIDKDRTFDDYIETSRDLRSRGMDQLRQFRTYSALSGGFYVEYISPWFETFGPAFRVVFFEDLAADPRRVVEGICEWLEIPAEPAAGIDYAVQNRTVLYKNERVQRLALAANDRGERFLRRHPLLKAGLRRIYYRFNRDDESARLDPAARRGVNAIYAASNAALAAELAARGYTELPAWLR